MNGRIYLDEAATAGYKNIDNIIVDTMTNSMKNLWQNPSSLYATDVKETIDKCRTNIAEFIGAKSDEIYFTSGATESNNMAIRGWVDWISVHTSDIAHIITTPIEHKSILEVTKNGTLHANIYYCRLNKTGVINYMSLERLLSMCEFQPILVGIQMANNEIGTIQDIRYIADLVHEYNGVIHVDATQAFGHIPINIKNLDIDMMSVSGHKISPVLKGIGFLYKKNGINIRPIIYGTQERGLRGGTENTFGIIGLSKAVELCDVSAEKIKKLCDKRNYFLNLLEDYFGCKLNGSLQSRLPNNINVTFPQNITSESLLYTLDLSGIEIGVGSACNSHSIEPSHVLKAIGISDEDAMKTVRFTLPEDITYEYIDCVVNEIDKAIKIIES